MQLAQRIVYLAGHDDSRDPPPYGSWNLPSPEELDDLPYRVEVWDESGSVPETLVAISASASLAYATYYAAAREFFGRDITITHKGMTLAHWRARQS